MSFRVTSEKELRDIFTLARSEGWTKLAIALDATRWQIDELREESWPEDRIIVRGDFVVSDWSALSSLTALTSLNLVYNKIGEEGARALSALTALTSLSLGYNEIGEEGARALSTLSALTSLDLRSNQIGTEGACALSSLTALTSLSLGDNKIGDEGARALSALTTLTSLSLGDNKIGEEGACALSSLTALTSLYLWSNQIGTEGAHALSSLTALTSLNLRFNGIGDQGARALSSLTALTWLDLGSNQIGTEGACALSSLTALTSLDLGSNEIGTEGARALSSLTALTWLDLGSNEIGTEGACALSSLTALTWLDLGSNEIGTEGARALSSLTALTSLNLVYNKIGTEGACALSSLTALTSLRLDGCALTRFPVELLALNDLSSLNVLRNPIVDLSPELWSKESNCLPAVRAHFADLQQGAEADRELKLILLGNGRVGKTSIVRFLMNEPFDNNEVSTHGIQLRARSELLDGHDVRINIWDFGGQDIYFNTHALFLKSRAVFMIVWDAETERQSCYVERELQFENRPLQYWLDYVRTVSPDSAVIVVQNKCDDGKGIEPNADLGSAERTSFSALNHQLNGEVLIGMLRSAIRRSMQHPAVYNIGRGRWRVKQQIRNWLEEDNNLASNGLRQHQLLSHPDFLALCEEEPGTVSSPDLLLQFLHDTGVVYYQSNLFNNQIILDQRWSIEAIYTIFHRGKCYRQLRERGGRFQLRDLADLVWDEQGFSADEQQLFLSFMRSCSICFIVGCDGSDPVYVAPQLLPALSELPPTILRRRQERLESVNRCSASYCRFRHRFLHEGIMLRFMARIGEVFGDSAIYWRDGVQIDWPLESKKPATTDRAVAEIVCHHKLDGNPSRGEILLTAWGEGREALLAAIQNEFEELHGSDRAIEEAASLDGVTWVTPTEADRSILITELLLNPESSTDKRGLKHLFRRDLEQLFKRLKDSHQSLANPHDIYISYPRGEGDNEPPQGKLEFVNRLFESLKADGYVVRRYEDIPYKGDLNVYVEELGRAACIVAVVSQHSLRSPACMYELIEIQRNLQFRERLFPVVFPDVKLLKVKHRLELVAHWKKEYQDLEALVKQVGIEVLHKDGSFLDYQRIRSIAQNIDEVLGDLARMKTPPHVNLEANDFELLKQAIIEWFKKLRGNENPPD